MEFFARKEGTSALDWIAGKAPRLSSFLENGLERIYRYACGLETLQPTDDIVLFGWIITFRSDGTALAENDLTGEIIELDAQQGDEVRGAALPPARLPN
jgi:hypothetical protein